MVMFVMKLVIMKYSGSNEFNAVELTISPCESTSFPLYFFDNNEHILDPWCGSFKMSILPTLDAIKLNCFVSYASPVSNIFIPFISISDDIEL